MPIVKEIQEKLFFYAKKINAPRSLIPLVNESNDLAYPYIETDDSGLLYFVIRERGVEYERRLMAREEDLFYLIFSKVTFSMASQFELENRIESQDSRKVIFEKQIELLKILDEEWAKREKWYNL
ncbi:MAG TPA: Imm63 family immunity protein [Chitinophagaceae bacterium]|nr:Imm63 family immunity protein [Chitinophagaceae bacterium]